MSTVNLQDWVGKKEEETDRIYPTPVKALAVTLNYRLFEPREGVPLPELWHWLYFLPMVAMADLGVDGHPKRGGFLPPVSLERRMWASGRFRFHHDLRIGEEVRRTSEILDISEKTGKSGEMVFVTIRHLIHSAEGVALEEEQDIVYIRTPESYVRPEPRQVPMELHWKEAYPIDPVLLFRFSALTFNSHRIHYDWRYATEVERYPGRLVHGPLQGLLLMESAKHRHPSKKPASYRFRSIYPIFEFDTLYVCGHDNPDGSCELYTADGEGHMATLGGITWK
ncbi:MAG: MaoC family dehydratase N-terminal domain-containing protein [Thermodesulfobacteriota bacterium]